jgi:hypothetical protein
VNSQIYGHCALLATEGKEIKYSKHEPSLQPIVAPWDAPAELYVWGENRGQISILDSFFVINRLYLIREWLYLNFVSYQT